MNIELDRDHILGGLAEIWTEWSDWAEGLTEGDWATPSRCPGSVSYTHLTLPTILLV